MSKEDVPAEPAMVFIGGVGRSGTSVTRELLGLHPDVAALPFEYRFLIDPDGIIDFLFGHQEMWSPYLYDLKLKRLHLLFRRLARKCLKERVLSWALRHLPVIGARFTKASYLNWELDHHLPEFSKLTQELINELRIFHFRGHWIGSPSFQFDHHIDYIPPDHERLVCLCQKYVYRLMDNWLEKTNKSLVVEDNTWNLLYADKLLRFFPNARFLHVVRDPRDVVYSFLGQNWMPSDMTQAAQIVTDLYAQIREIITHLPKDNIKQVKLEHLINADETTLLELQRFCNLKPDPVLSQFPWQASVVGKWKKGLNMSSQQQLQSALQAPLRDLGYGEGDNVDRSH